MTSGSRRAQGGFALVLAILALLMLTFLGLTLAATTSTELQISNNYRWGQQALYNAEAGLEVARGVLNRVGDGQLVLPPARTITWNPRTVPNPVPPANAPNWSFPATRNGESGFCDTWANGVGYGQVLVEPSNPAAPFENVHTVLGQSLTGTFTVWVRRELVMAAGPAFSDSPLGENVIVTAEGSAPFGAPGTAGSPIGNFTRANRAIRRLEAKVTVKEGCREEHNSTSQTGGRMCEGVE